MLTQSLENTYQNLKLSDKIRQVFVLSLIFLGLLLFMNFLCLIPIKLKFIAISSYSIRPNIKDWNAWVYAPILYSFYFFIITFFVSLTRLQTRFLVFTFPFLYFILNHLVFIFNLQEVKSGTVFATSMGTWTYWWIHHFYFGYQFLVSPLFIIEGMFDHEYFVPYTTLNFYADYIFLPNIYILLITFLTKKIYNFLRT